MQEISLSEFKKLRAEEVGRGACLKVTADGELLFIAVIKPEGVMQDKIRAFASQIDASRGF